MSSPLIELIEIFRRQKLTLSFAESCTGGKLSALLTEQAGVSDIFLGSVVSYANDVKVNLLGVRRNTLENEGAVSEKVALQMAQGVRQQLHSDWSVAITGIAGPSGGSPDKPVGTIWFAVCGPNFEVTEKKMFRGTRVEVQTQATDHAIQKLLQAAKPAR